MYTPEQIRAAGISGEISSIDVEHLINILKRENGVTGISECYFTPNKISTSATICANCGKEKFLHTIGQGIKATKAIYQSDINTDTKIEEDLIYRIVENWGNSVCPISEMVKWLKEYVSIVNERKYSSDSDAIEFADWLGKENRVCFLCADGVRRWHELIGSNPLSTEQLYETFRESQPQKESK